MCESGGTPAPDTPAFDSANPMGRAGPMAIEAAPSSFYSPWPDRLRHSAIILLAAAMALAVLVALGELSLLRAAAVFVCIGAAALVPWRLNHAVASREDGRGGHPGGGAGRHAGSGSAPRPRRSRHSPQCRGGATRAGAAQERTCPVCPALARNHHRA